MNNQESGSQRPEGGLNATASGAPQAGGPATFAGGAAGGGPAGGGDSPPTLLTFTVDDGIGLLRLGHPSEKIVVLNEGRMAALEKQLEFLTNQRSLKGLIITGASPGGFCAGADISAIDGVTDPATGEALARKGQSVFQKIADLPYPTVAAIQGACAGGGCELALACTHRIISAARESKIGLPEIKLGILPGFGGTQRLPRLVGIRKGLDLILKARLLSGEEARRAGLVDAVVGAAGTALPELEKALLVHAAGLITRGSKPSRQLPFVERFLTFNGLGRKIVRGKSEALVKKETKGLYPAPIRAIESVFYGLEHGLIAGLEQEARFLGELVVGSECKSLVHIYRVSESASKLGRSVAAELAALEVTVVGAGVMGAGIASSFLARDVPVTLQDSSPEALEKGRAHIQSTLGGRRGLSAEAKSALLQKLRIGSGKEPVREGARAIVIEAIVEDLGVKQKVLGEYASHVGPTGILATNTSSLSVSALADTLPNPERVVGIHFFNPAEKMPLVEVVRAKKTNEKTLVLAAAAVSHLGKYPIVVEDVPGFLVNRVLTPYLAEAGTMLSQGVAIRAIDKAALQFGMPMGPIRLLDEVGLDVAAKVQSVITEAYGDRMAGPAYAALLVQNGRLGKKNGRGFYKYEEGRESDDPSVLTLLGLPSRAEPWILESDLAMRLILPMVNEAVRCLDEGVAGMPGADAAGQIDLGTVMGTGFAPFRGGVLWYAESIGAAELRGLFDDLTKKYGKRFLPCDGIVRRAELGASFYQGLE